MWINGVTLQPRLASDSQWKVVRTPKRRGPPVSDSAVKPNPQMGMTSAPVQPDAALPPLVFPFDRLPTKAQRWHRWAQSLPPSFTGGDWNDIRADLTAVLESNGVATHPLGAIPVIVLTAGLNDFEDEREASAATQKDQFLRGQQRLASLSLNSRQLMAAHSGHRIHLEEPDLVVEAIRQVIEAARTRKPLCCRESR